MKNILILIVFLSFFACKNAQKANFDTNISSQKISKEEQMKKLAAEIDSFQNALQKRLSKEPNNPNFQNVSRLLNEIKEENDDNLQLIKSYQQESIIETQHFLSEQEFNKNKNSAALIVLMGMISVDSKIISAEKSFGLGSYELTKEGKDTINLVLKQIEKIAKDYLQKQSENRMIISGILKQDTAKLKKEIIEIEQHLSLLKKRKNPKDATEILEKENVLKKRLKMIEEKSMELAKKPEIKFRLTALGYSDSQDFSQKTADDLLLATQKNLPFFTPTNENEKLENRKFLNKLLSHKRAESVFNYIRSELKYQIMEDREKDILGMGEEQLLRRVCKFNIIPVSIK